MISDTTVHLCHVYIHVRYKLTDAFPVMQGCDVTTKTGNTKIFHPKHSG